jgi:Na+-transporting NADH:ubiquinone oxidoreductase subunit NqrB
VRVAGLDDFLARRTPGNLLLIFLILLLAGAFVLSLLKDIEQKPLALIFTTALVSVTCLATDWAFAHAFGAKSKFESVIITALILALIISPVASVDYESLALPIFASSWAMASKYVIALNRRHLFNPAAFGVALADHITGHAASWWVGSYWLLPLVLGGGLLLLRKIRCLDLLLSFTVTALGAIALMSSSGYAWIFVRETLLRSAFCFFAIVMLTEPRTLPFGRPWRIAFGALVGFFFAPATHFGMLRFTPEVALLIGNIFAAAAKWVRRRNSQQTKISSSPKGSSLARYFER